MLQMKRNAGLTLSEILVVLLISGIIMSIAFAVFSSGWRVYGATRETALLSRNLRNIVERISEELRWAREVEFDDSLQGNDWIVITLENGTIKRFQASGQSRMNEQSLSDPSDIAVSNLSMTMRTVEDNRVMFDVSLTASSKGNSKISETVGTSIAIYNLRSISGSGSTIGYKK